MADTLRELLDLDGPDDAVEMTVEAAQLADAEIRHGLETFERVGLALLAMRDGRGYRHRARGQSPRA